ncbi:MAG: hypothetical protein NT083_00925 [Rhodocyclales bacterium]|nr:hypothetical protein [Rhodocyclales bacterium]
MPISRARTHDVDFAVFGELDGIVGIVDQHLAEPQRVADDIHRNVAGDVEDQFQPLLPGFFADHADHAGQGGFQFEVGLLDGELAGLDLGNVENVVDDAQQMLARELDLLDVFALVGRHCGHQHQVRHADDAVHRRADFVAHVGEEVGLHARGFLRQFAGAAHFRIQRAAQADILQYAEVAADAAVEGTDRRGQQRAAELRAVFAREGPFAVVMCPQPDTGDQYLEIAADGNPLRRPRRPGRLEFLFEVKQFSRHATDHFDAAPAEQAFGAAVENRDAAVEVGGNDADFGRRLEDLAE